MCHSFDGQGFAAKRAGLQMLQGSYFAPSAFPGCLYDTRLQPTHFTVDSSPFDNMPVHCIVGDRTSFRRHLPYPLSRFFKLSRNEMPGGSTQRA